MDLFESLPATFIGAFLGTFAAFLSERLLRRRDARYREVAALNNLITDLHLRRALAASNPVATNSGPNSDREYVTTAVLQIRDSIRDTRLCLRPNSSDEFQSLVGMSSACNEYLERVQYNPAEYQFALSTLRLSFAQTIRTLGIKRSVIAREPGAGAFDVSVSV